MDDPDTLARWGALLRLRQQSGGGVFSPADAVAVPAVPWVLFRQEGQCDAVIEDRGSEVVGGHLSDGCESKGVSSRKLTRGLGITQKSAWPYEPPAVQSVP